MNSIIAAPNLIKFFKDVDEFIPLLNRLLAFQYCNPFWNASKTNKGMSILPILPVKLVAVATVLEKLQNK